MSFMRYGLLKGLNIKNDWDQDILTSQRNEALTRSAQEHAETKAQLLGEKFKFAKAENEWDKAALKEFQQAKLSEIGKYVTENPDFQTNFMKWNEFSALTGELLENDIAERALRVDGQKTKLIEYMNENELDMDDPDILSQFTALDNYNKTGSIDGIGENKKEFVFQKPVPFDMTSDINTLAKRIKVDSQIYDTGVYHGLENVIDEDQKAAVVGEYYAAKQDKIEKEFAKLPEYLQTYYTTPFQWVSKSLDAGIETGAQSVAKNYTYSGGSSGSGGYDSDTSNYLYNGFIQRVKTNTNPPVLSQNIALGMVTKGYTVGSYILNKDVGTTNSTVYVGDNLTPITLTGHDITLNTTSSTGKIIKDASGNPAFIETTLYTDKPLTSAEITQFKNAGVTYKFENGQASMTAYIPYDPNPTNTKINDWRGYFTGTDKSNLANMDASLTTSNVSSSTTAKTATLAQIKAANPGTTKTDAELTSYYESIGYTVTK